MPHLFAYRERYTPKHRPKTFAACASSGGCLRSEPVVGLRTLESAMMLRLPMAPLQQTPGQQTPVAMQEPLCAGRLLSQFARVVARCPGLAGPGGGMLPADSKDMALMV